MDNTDSFNKEDGAFVAPIAGTYMFLFNAFARTADKAELYIQVNGVTSQYVHEFDVVDNQIVSFWSLDLVQEDEVKIYNEYSSSIYIDGGQSLYFFGMLIN